MDQTDEFLYVSLPSPDHIRLVEIQAGRPASPLILKLESTALNAAPPFEALSYCWGNLALPRVPVICNGAKLLLTPSLHSGLLHFRHADSSRLMWADAVCINQGDVAEKGQQVRLMPNIYSSAAHVLVWLGPNPDTASVSASSASASPSGPSRLLPTIPADIAANIRTACGFIPAFDVLDAESISAASTRSHEETERLHREGRPNLLDRDWRPFGALLARPWFRRKWVVQEIALAREAVFLFAGGPGGGGAGAEEARSASVSVNVRIAWKDLAELIDGIASLGWQGALTRTRMAVDPVGDDSKGLDVSSTLVFHRPLICVNAMLMVQRYRHFGTLLDGVMNTRHFDCSNGRDHVYALLGLGASGPTVQPDYSLSEAEAFTQFATSILLEGGSNALKVLGIAPQLQTLPRKGRERLTGLPSWVPDLRIFESESLINYTIRPQRFHAGGRGFMPDLSISLEYGPGPGTGLGQGQTKDQEKGRPSTLSVRGKTVDSIQAVATSFVDLFLADIPDAQLLEGALRDPNTERKARRFNAWLRGNYCLAAGGAGAGLSKDKEASFARTMLCDMDHLRYPLPDDAITSFPAYMQWHADRAASTQTESDTASDKLEHEAIWTAAPDTPHAYMIEISLGGIGVAMRFGVTELGRFCQLPLEAKPGDRVCVLVGCEIPLVIRDIGAAGSGKYELIGGCYVNGIMNGEGLGMEDGPSSLGFIHLQ